MSTPYQNYITEARPDQHLVDRARMLVEQIGVSDPGNSPFWSPIIMALATEFSRIASEATRTVQWQPIEAAPKDGTEIILLSFGSPSNQWRRTIGSWREGAWKSDAGKLLGGDFWFCGWAHLPALSPTPQSQAAEPADAEEKAMPGQRVCCKIGCGKPADYEINHRHPYEFVDSCAEHIGELLTDAPHHTLSAIRAERPMFFQADADTPPLALCIAALKARATHPEAKELSK